MRPDLRTSTNRVMVAKRKLTIETLTKLGRRKLAELLIAEAAGQPDVLFGHVGLAAVGRHPHTGDAAVHGHAQVVHQPGNEVEVVQR